MKKFLASYGCNHARDEWPCAWEKLKGQKPGLRVLFMSGYTDDEILRIGVSGLVKRARGLVKPFGERLPKCGTSRSARELSAGLSAELRDVLDPLLAEIESLNQRIQEYDKRMEKIAKEVYPEVSLAPAGEGCWERRSL